MAFKDIWKPRVDGVDDLDSSAVNEIADALIGFEEKSNIIFSAQEEINNTVETELKEKADKKDIYPKTEIEERLPKIIPYNSSINIDTLYGYQYLTNPTMYLIQSNAYGESEFLFVYSSAGMKEPDYIVEEEFFTYQVKFSSKGVQYRINPSWSVAQWSEWISYATTKDLDVKANKTIVEKSTDTAYSFEFSATDNTEVRLAETTSVSFTFGNGEYSATYTSGLSFDSGATPTSIDYTDSGILNWVGTDCTTVDGLSIFQPSANTHYDIVFYFNGTQFIGLVNGFVPSVSR